MDTITLCINFEDSEGKSFSLRLKDIRANITSTEVSELTNKIIDENFLTVKGKSIVKLVNAEKITTELIL